MRRIKIILSFCLLLICALGFAQTASDYRKAAEQGDANAQYNLGVCYENGYGVMQDYSQAVYWYRKAAEQGDAFAQCNLGSCYGNGKGVTQDYSQAVYWYRKAVEQGNAEAQCNLGTSYGNGEGVTQDYSKAVYWFRKAAEQGNAVAQYNLGVCYRNGKGVTRDNSQAVYWYRKAAEQGNAEAQFTLGTCYYYGEGVKKDKDLAEEWLTKVIDNPKSSEHLQDLSEDLIDEMWGVNLQSILRLVDGVYGDGHLIDSIYDKIVYGDNNYTPDTKDHDYVDLGLSVMWATCNVGATKPEDYGDYFAWGETKPKDKYFWSNLKYCNDSDGESFSKYNHNKPGTKDNKVRLELNDDAARANWGGSWRMPTYLEFEELLTRCNWVWTTMNGVRGYKVKSKSNGNSIFLPATGYYIGAGYFMNGQCSSYWSANITKNNTGDAWNVLIDENGHKIVDGPRHCGFPVRPVFFGTHENNKSNTQSENVTPTNSNTYSPSEKVYSSTEVDISPRFNGGDMGEFTKWVNQNVVYPDIAKQYDIKGRVITKFTIHSNGQISDIQILKGVDPSLDKEAINVLKKAPALTPAKKGGENVAVSYMLPIDFGR